VVDDDIVSLSNLQRQIIHATPDVGRRKVDTAAERIYALNPHVRFAAHATRLDADNAMELIGGYDLVLDGSDNFETRYLVSDALFPRRQSPLITAALGTFDGSLTTIRAHEKNAEGEFNPTYRCLFPEPPPPGTVPACAEAGVMGALAGVLGSLMALEAIREIVGFGEGLVGRLLMVDARAMRFRDAALPARSAKSAQRRCACDHRSERASVRRLPWSAHSMLGSTRSGGLWLSRKVRMLMITFSPISTRPSMVAEPICGSSVTLPAFASRTSFGLTAGSFSYTSRPAPPISPASINLISVSSSITSPRAVLTI